jgi:mannosyltransferase OCH1-like enzyme
VYDYSKYYPVRYVGVNDGVYRPKVINAVVHQTWKSEVLPWEQKECLVPNFNKDCIKYRKWKKAYMSVREMNPGYDFIFWTDKNITDFIEKEYPWFLETFKSYPYNIQRVDAARYFILYHYGGIYMDMDIGCLRSLDPLRQFQVVLPATNPSGFSNDFLMSVPRHPFFKNLTDNLSDWNHYYGTKYPTVFISTGPYYVNHQYVLYPQKQEIDILPTVLYSGNTSDTFLLHYDGNSWHAIDGEIILGIYTHWWTIIGIFVLAVCGFLYYLYINQRFTIYYDWGDGQPHLE